MAEKIISPGVFTQENDQSFLPVGVGEIGAAIIGPTLKGPAFIPTKITKGYQEFINLFGDTSPDTYVPYTVKNYLKSAGTVTVIRVMGEEPWSEPNAYELKLNSQTVAYLVPTTEGQGYSDVAIGAGSGTDEWIISSSLAGAGFTTSFDPTSPKYIANILGSNPKTTSPNTLANAYYLYRFFPVLAATSQSATLTIIKHALTFNDNKSYNNGETPYITSQLVSGEAVKLFKIGRKSDGIDSNYDTHVTIEDIKAAGTVPGTAYGQFNLFVRTVNGFFDSTDTDQRPQILESWLNLNLDPLSPNYICRRIGDEYQVADNLGVITTNGEYPSLSKYIYIIPHPSLKSIPTVLVPKGFEAVLAPISSSTLPGPIYNTVQGSSTSSYDSRVEFGFNFFDDDSLQYLWSLPDGGSVTTVAGITLNNNNTAVVTRGNFNLDHCFAHPSASNVPGTNGVIFSGSLSSSYAPPQMLKFAIPFQGGHEGMPYNRVKNTGANILPGNVFGFNCATNNTSGSIQYIKAINILSNADDYDMNLLVTPGILSSQHSSITSAGISLCDTRGDALYIMDTSMINASLTTAVNDASGFDDNYTATYFPWVKILDSNTNNYVWVPASVVVPEAIAFNDKVGYEWNAPAGLNRGGLPGVYQAYLKLGQADRDQLYLGRVNPIATFPGQGVVIWGQKTLQAKPSALDRVNVRRLLITAKKYIASSTRYLVFENSVQATWTRFSNIVNPYLEKIQRNNGLYAFKVVMDSSNNTADLIDRNIMYGQIYLQPAKAAEFILIDFNITPTGATFGA